MLQGEINFIMMCSLKIKTLESDIFLAVVLSDAKPKKTLDFLKNMFFKKISSNKLVF